MLDKSSPPLPPLFVVGCPRSGTSLLSSLLKRTPWGTPFETHFITKYHGRLRRYGELRDRKPFHRLVRAILSERPVRQWKLDLDIDALRESLERFDFANIVDAICRANTRRNGLRSWGDKTPQYIQQLQTIHELFPVSPVIYIARDGRDVAMSLMREPWGPANILTCARFWKQCNDVEVDLGHLRQKGLLHALRYEDLLTAPERELDSLLRFLGVEPAGAADAQLLQRIRKSNSGKWKSQLSADEIRLFENVASETLRKLGYDTTHEERPVPRATAFWFQAQDRWKHYAHLVKMNTVEAVAIRWGGREPFAQ